MLGVGNELEADARATSYSLRKKEHDLEKARRAVRELERELAEGLAEMETRRLSQDEIVRSVRTCVEEARRKKRRV